VTDITSEATSLHHQRSDITPGNVNMIFMSQSGLTDPARSPEWDAWYIEHLRIMMSVPAVSSAQRLVTDSPGYSPSLAMYTVPGPEVFTDPYYLSVRGMGEWSQHIDRRHYHRNLFAGLDRAPPVTASERLIVAGREREDAALADLELAWLKCVGIDRSTPLRGIAVVEAAAAEKHRSRDLAIYRPMTEAMVSDAFR
jgi:hypothetical protein